MLFLPSLGILEFLLVVWFPFLIDFDFLFSKFAKDRNHRRLITHSLFPYIALLIIGIFFPLILILGICGLVHVITDSIDWGTALFTPLYRAPIGGILPKPPKEIVEIPNYRKRQCWFTKTYYESKPVLTLEISFGALSVLLIIFLNIWYIWIIIFYLFFLILNLRFHFKCRGFEK